MKKLFFMIKERLAEMKLFKLVILALNICMLTAVIVLGIVLKVGSHSLPDQLMASRWSEDKDVAQISCFYSGSAYITEQSILEMRYNVEKKLKEQAIEANTVNARVYIDAYSSEGKISVQSDKKTIEANAIGVGGDFFMFHPVELVSGMYFDGNDIMQDSVLLDEEAAWQLFGANDIAGKTITIGGMPYRVAGVYTRADGDLETMAGSKDTTIYMSYGALESVTACSVGCYEIVLPNPVEGFAMNIILEANLSAEEAVKMVENSNRFSYVSLYNVWKERASRSMKTDDIVYPFWENLARVKEESLMEVALWQVVMASILLIYWCVWGIIFMIKHKPTVKTFTNLWEKIEQKNRLRRRKANEKRRAKEEERNA